MQSQQFCTLSGSFDAPASPSCVRIMKKQGKLFLFVAIHWDALCIELFKVWKLLLWNWYIMLFSLCFVINKVQSTRHLFMKQFSKSAKQSSRLNWLLWHKLSQVSIPFNSISFQSLPQNYFRVIKQTFVHRLTNFESPQFIVMKIWFKLKLRFNVRFHFNLNFKVKEQKYKSLVETMNSPQYVEFVIICFTNFISLSLVVD